MGKTFDVIALGELLIDFTENGESTQGNPLMEANPGGAPCNVLAMLAKLGKRVAFVGKVGKDMFGRQLRDAAAGAGICMDYLLEDDDVHTTLAFVKTYPGGDRDFSFYRNPGADMMLRSDELPLEALQSTRIFHFGTLSMTHPQVREATQKAVAVARASGALISLMAYLPGETVTLSAPLPELVTVADGASLTVPSVIGYSPSFAPSRNA